LHIGERGRVAKVKTPHYNEILYRRAKKTHAAKATRDAREKIKDRRKKGNQRECGNPKNPKKKNPRGKLDGCAV